MKKPYTVIWAWDQPGKLDYRELPPGDTLDKLEKHAEIVLGALRKMVDSSLKPDEVAVKALSVKVDAGRLSWDEEVSAVMGNLCGAFLGKAILCTYSDRNVRWVQANNDFGILFPAPSGGPIKIAFPVARVLEQIEHGEQYSIHGFFKMLPEFMGPL